MRRENDNDLMAFVEVARERSVTKAVAKLGVSQSTLRVIPLASASPSIFLQQFANHGPSLELETRPGHQTSGPDKVTTRGSKARQFLCGMSPSGDCVHSPKRPKWAPKADANASMGEA